jgi:peptide/nickel transport system substrate-binding protein
MGKSRFGRRLWGTVGVVSLFIAACGGGSTSSSGPASAVPATQDPNAVAGGTFNLGVWQEPSSFLAAGITDSLTFSYLIDSPVTEGLLWYRSANETSSAKSLADYWAPDLATEVPTTANGDVKTSGCATAGAKMCVTWKLRQGVKWDDGSTFGPTDVCDTFQLYFLKYGLNTKPNPTALLTTSGWDQTIKCTADATAYTATIDFKAIYAPYLGLGSGTYGILPASVLDKALAGNADVEKQMNTFDFTSANPAAFKGTSTLDLAIDGTGPYVFQSYTQGKEIVYVINQHYWNKDHQPHIQKLVFKIEADLTSEVNAAKAGDVDMSFDMRLYNLQGLITASTASSPKIKVQTIPDSGAEKIDLNLCANDGTLCDNPAVKKNPYTADLTIRKAMLEGINRQAIIDNQAAGKTSIPRDSFMYLGIEYIDDPTIPTTAYDKAGANKLLDDAGYTRDAACGNAPDGQPYRKFKDGTCIKVTIGTTAGNPSREATEVLVANDLSAIGINVATPYANLKSGAFFGSFADGGPLYTHSFNLGMYTNTVSSPAEPDSWYAGYHADCGGSCPTENQIPSTANSGNGQNDTGTNSADIDKNFDLGRTSVDLTQRTTAYKAIEHDLAAIIPEIPLYQQVTVDAYSTKLQGLRDNDLVWDYNSFDWYCTGGNCQA